MQITIYDPTHTSATPQQILQKFYGVIATEPAAEDDDLDDLARVDTGDLNDLDEDEELDEDGPNETDDPKEAEQVEKRKRKHRLAKLKRKTKLRAYEFSGMSDVAGVLFLEIQKITDLPPERNSKRQLIWCRERGD